MSTKKAANETANETRGKSKQKSVILRDFFSLGNTQEEKGEPSPLVSDYIVSIMENKTIEDYLQCFSFKKEEEIQKAMKRLVYAVALDPYLNEKSNRDTNPANAIAFNLSGYMKKPGELKSFIDGTARNVWQSCFLPRFREERHKKMFPEITDQEKFDSAFKRIMEIYNLDNTAMYRFQLFALQLRLRDYYPVSEQRVLYIWGKMQKTGKSTIAKIITSIGNGTLVFDNDFKINLQAEIQKASEIKLGMPKIGMYNCATADEVFSKGRSNNNIYQYFKALVTSEGGTCRNPYGQPFVWHGRANYVFTSNYPLQDFIQDYRDRRFLEIEIVGKPEHMNEVDLILIWKDFITNAEPRKQGELPMILEDFIKYVGEMSDVEGAFTQGVEAIKTVIESQSFLNLLEGKSYEISINAVMTMVQQLEESFKHDKEISKELYKTAMIEIFGDRDPKKYSWSKMEMVKVLNEKLNKF